MNWYKTALKKQELHLVGFIQQDKNGVYDTVKITKIDNDGIKRIALNNVSPEDFNMLVNFNKLKNYQEMKNIINKYSGNVKIANSNYQSIVNMQQQMQRKRQNYQITDQQYKQYLQKLIQAKRQLRKNSTGINK